MGEVVSTGATNSELVDNMVHAEILKSAEVEKVFRAVDRGVYYLPEHRDGAYKDRAWKHKNLHMSAPCIYGEVMEALEFKKGLSFLNLGSGTGYLSTMAGLILGTNGINHGVEFHQDVVDYSEEKLRDFILWNEFFDAFEFCSPVFHCGNCLNLSPTTMKYDRVYCGAACSPENENYMKSLVKVGGLLVMPIREELVKVERLTETNWESKVIMAVSFADLIPSAANDKHLVELSEPTVLSLQELCRTSIRRVLRKIIEDENPETKLFVLQCKGKKNKRLKNERKPFHGDDICAISNGNSRPFIRVNFLPSGGRLMLIRNFSDNDEDDDNESGFGFDGENDNHQHSDEANNDDDIQDHVDTENENSIHNSLNVDNIDYGCRSTDCEEPVNCSPDSKRKRRNKNIKKEISKHDSIITDKINAVSLDKNLVEAEFNFQTERQTSDNEIEVDELNVDRKKIQEFSNCNNVFSSSAHAINFSSTSPCRSKIFKKQKLLQDEKGDSKKSHLVMDLFTAGSTQHSQSSSKDLNDCAHSCDSSEKTLNENESCHEKLKVTPGHPQDRDVGGLMSISSGIGTHESLETDDISGFESSCDQQDLQTNSPLSSSSPSSISLSSPLHSKGNNKSNPKDGFLVSQPPTPNTDFKNELLAAKEEENNESDGAAELKAVLLDYRKHMKDKITCLQIPLMLKRFLLYDRV